MRIAIIDSGIDSKHKRLDSCVVSGVSIHRNRSTFDASREFHDLIGHGTACAAIIHRLMAEAELVAVRIFHHELHSDEQTLCAAIRWSLHNDCDVINMSLGVTTENPSSEMCALCNEAFERNIPIVAAGNSYDASLEVYPAYFPSVFGVMAGHIRKRNGYGYRPKSPLQFVAKGTTQRLASTGGRFTIGGGTSYACAHFTGIVAKVIDETGGLIDLCDLKQELIKGADNNVRPLQESVELGSDKDVPIIARHDLDNKGRSLFVNQSKVSWVGSAALFPASEKEMNAFLMFPRLCSCEMVSYFDFPHKITGSLEYRDAVLNRLPLDEEYDRFDSVIIGYFYENPFDGNIRFGYDLVLEMIKRNKNIYAFDLVVERKLNEKFKKLGYRGIVYAPVINDETYEELMCFRYLPKINTPVVAVIGTSNRQGKFTTQLRLKQILGGSGYKVSHVSTEPQGELLGAEFVFHYGHKSGTVQVSRDKWMPLLRSTFKGVQEFNNPDIILTGTQGGIVPRRSDYSNPTTSLDYLFGVQPDVVICAINPQDSIELITANVRVSEIYCNAKTVLFTMTPWLRNYRSVQGRYIAQNRRLDSDEMKAKMGYFETTLGTPVMDIMDERNEPVILRLIQESFS